MKKVELTKSQTQAMEVARVAFMNQCPFFCFYFYDQLSEYPTLDVDTAATDGRRLYYNPEYLEGLQPSERVFVLAHEVFHAISRHPTRIKHYRSQDTLRGLPWDQDLFNISADLPINAALVKDNIGRCNPTWLFDPKQSPDELPEDVYERLYKQPPPSSKGGPGKPDKTAQANGGRVGDVLPPKVDPATGKEDIPDQSEFREAVARAAAAAKAMGKMPGTFQRMVDEILTPQVDWREHVRMLITGRIGSRSDNWARPNRRRLVLNPIVILPSKQGYGAGTVAIGVDTSGSIGEKELATFFAEVGGVLSDVRPREVMILWCDAQVHRVDVASTMDELADIRAQGAPGGGGTDFRPVFARLEEDNVRPDCLIYLTDMFGSFPNEAPRYPTIWCSTSKGVGAPFGDLVEISVSA
jgi:predicted metal-dependent peptidase